MPNMGFGLTTGGIPALRIAYDNTTNLITESSSSYGKFLLDSLNGTKLSYIFEIVKHEYNSSFTTGGYLGGTWFFDNHDKTSGYNASNHGLTCGAMAVWNNTGSGTQTWWFFSNWWSFGYMPIMEARLIKGAGGDTFDGPTLNLSNLAGGTGWIDSYNVFQTLTAAKINSNFFGSGSREAYEVIPKTTAGVFPYLMSTLQLPARDDAMSDFSTTPVSGQIPLLLNPTVARLALPGRDVTDTNSDHYIFHEDKIPAKIMAAGEINVALGGTATINTSLPLTKFTYMDYHVRRQTDTEFWNPPLFSGPSESQQCSFTYQVLSSSVVITNTADFAITVRYFICADSEDVPTTGGKKVFLRDNDGTRDYIQIKRPGSSDLTPNLNDIMVDTRLAYMPILAQGFLSWTTDFPTVISGGDRYKGERMATVSVTNPSPSLKLFVKQGVVFKSNCYTTASRWNYHKVWLDSGTFSGRCSQDSSWARIYADNSAVDFYMAGDNPLVFNSTTNIKAKEWPSTADSSALGLRYYIFGIPSSL